MKREELFAYVKQQYNTIPEYLWRSDPHSAVLRHPGGKWYGIVMRVSQNKLGLKEEQPVDIINVKCKPDMAAMVTQTDDFFPGYHMNKRYWITILLDGTVSREQILDFLDESYLLIDKSIRT